MGWHELADIELRFRPFVESSVAGDVFGPLRVDLGWIFLSVVDTRQLKASLAVRTLHMASMRRERRVRELCVLAACLPCEGFALLTRLSADGYRQHLKISSPSPRAADQRHRLLRCFPQTGGNVIRYPPAHANPC